MRTRVLSVAAALALAAPLCGCAPVGYSACPADYCGPPPGHAYGGDYVYVTPHPIARPPGPGDLPFEDPGADYARRSVTISPGAGDSHAANLAMQTATPWPRHAQNTNIPDNGARVARTMKEFESGTREKETEGRRMRTEIELNQPAIRSGQ